MARGPFIERSSISYVFETRGGPGSGCVEGETFPNSTARPMNRGNPITMVDQGLENVRDGLVVVVSGDCDTCRLITPTFTEIARGPGAIFVSQDDPQFPQGVETTADPDLALSWKLQAGTTPTLYRLEEGRVTEKVEGWDRQRWRELTAIPDLGADLPDRRPGCGSKIFEPGTYETLKALYDSSLRSRSLVFGADEDVFEAMYARGWSDGLPLIPPTKSRVLSILEGTTRQSDEVVAVMPPDLVECTVEKVAVNAVMAGCRPEYLPVVLAACEAVATERFNIHGVAATTQFVGVVLIVNGPIRHRIGMNAGINVLGPGNRANSTIGRAVNLVIRNVGGAVPGEIDSATLGSPAKISLCFPEDEEGSPWNSLAVERGFGPNESTVTAFAGHGPHEIVDQLSREPASLANSMAAQLRSVGHPKLMGSFDALVVISPEHAGVFAAGGWSKERLRRELFDRLTFSGDEVQRGAGGTAEGVPPAKVQTTLTKFRSEGLWFVHAGGAAGKFSGIIGGWVSGPRGTEMTTTSVDDWM